MSLKRNLYVAILVIAAFALDQVTKLAVIRTVDLGTSWPSDGFFRITHVANTGSAFGLFGGQNLVLTIVSVAGIGVLVAFYRAHQEPGPFVRVSLALMLAGALGNLTDRLVNGHVTDFIDIGPWYIFNLADASIVTGVAVLAASILVRRAAVSPDDAVADAEPVGVSEETDSAPAVEAPPADAHDGIERR